MLTFYTDRWMPDGVAACARGPVIFIRPAYRGDRGLLEHERVHRRQWLLTLGLHSFAYLLVRRYRLWAEVRAYQEQMRWPDRKGNRLSIVQAAARLSKPLYRLGLTLDQAMQHLRS